MWNRGLAPVGFVLGGLAVVASGVLDFVRGSDGLGTLELIGGLAAVGWGGWLRSRRIP